MHNGMADLSKAGITEPTDLISFPQDEQDEDDSDDDETPDPEEVREMLSHLRELNEENERRKAAAEDAKTSADASTQKNTSDH